METRRVKIYVASDSLGDDGYYAIRVYEGGRLLFKTEGDEIGAGGDRISMSAFALALELTNEETGRHAIVEAFTDSPYVWDTLVDRNYHRKNRDLYQRAMSNMSGKVSILRPNERDPKWLSTVNQVTKTINRVKREQRKVKKNYLCSHTP